MAVFDLVEFVMLTCVHVCVMLRLCGSTLGFTQDAVCAVADMMCNRCEAVRRGTSAAVPVDTGHVLPHLP